MKIFPSLFLLICSTFAFGQSLISGKILDAKNEEALAYVNIGVIGKNVGTVSDIHGNFQLEIGEQFDEDTLRISMVGYKTLDLIVKEARGSLAENQPLTLEKSITDLDEVIVKDKKLKEKVLGNKTTAKNIGGGFSNNQLGNEVGIIIKIKKSPSYLKKFKVSVQRNDYDTLRFRLNFYDLKNGLPHQSLQKENIIVTSQLKQGQLTVDLSPYHIVVEDDFFVSLEWIEDLGEDGLYFSANLFGPKLIVRQTSQGNWERIGMVSLGLNVTVLH